MNALSILLPLIDAGQELAGLAAEPVRIPTRRNCGVFATVRVWPGDIVEKGDELLIELVANAVESKAGIRPDDDDIASYLAGLAKPVFVVQGQTPVKQPKQSGSEKPSSPQALFAPPKPESDTPRAGTLVLSGKAYPYRNEPSTTRAWLRS